MPDPRSSARYAILRAFSSISHPDPFRFRPSGRSSDGPHFVGARATILNIRQVAPGIPYSGGTIIPDQIFALDYGGSFRAFILEVDRGTEPVSSTSARESLARKIAGYAQIVGHDLHRQHYGLKSPLAILFTFVSQARARRFMEVISADHPGLAAATLVQVLATDDPMILRAAEYVVGPWARVSGGTMEILKA